jgi:hypothetical protein
MINEFVLARHQRYGRLVQRSPHNEVDVEIARKNLALPVIPTRISVVPLF